MRVALGIEYDGTMFAGWQSQTHGNTVQDVLERALSTVADSPVVTVCAGRTDAGVHALAQVVHFDTEVCRPDSAWVRGTNANLPSTVAVCWAMPVSEEFHARFSATARSYRYLMFNHPVRPALLDGKVGWYHAPLDVEAMCLAAAPLLGKHDFSAFRASQCQAKSPVRTLRKLDIVRQGDMIVFDLEANAFLHHMVRNLVGTLVYVGNGRRPVGWMQDVLESRDRAKAAPTFSAGGLYLVGVDYGSRWPLPSSGRMMPPLLSSTS
jgi:tRNA pseudouridine38-40 synthase